MEARVGLVPASVFKTDEALREQRLGGFDSHAFPPMSGEKLERANVDVREMQYLSNDDGDLVFMDCANYEQLSVSAQLVGDAADLLTQNLVCCVSFLHERPIDVTLPTHVQLQVTAIEPVGAGNVTQKATVETGAVVEVPLLIRVGDTIKIDTRTHEYVERAERAERVDN